MAEWGRAGWQQISDRLRRERLKKVYLLCSCAEHCFCLRQSDENVFLTFRYPSPPFPPARLAISTPASSLPPAKRHLEFFSPHLDVSKANPPAAPRDYLLVASLSSLFQIPVGSISLTCRYFIDLVIGARFLTYHDFHSRHTIFFTVSEFIINKNVTNKVLFQIYHQVVILIIF